MFLFGKVFQGDLNFFQGLKAKKSRGFFRVNFGRESEIFLRIRKEYPKTFLKTDILVLSLAKHILEGADIDEGLECPL
jgi:hypothetical protein